ncbi:MAG: DinB family protein [Chloroflexi bacterium]|nr:DinB family protein [Chloroflexota bacterium]
MNAIEAMRLAFDDLHRAIREDMADTPREWLYWQPAPGLNHIAFLFWHIVRDEDHVIHRGVLRAPTLWEAEGWHQELGMDAEEQGTGFDSARLPELRYSLGDFWPYAERVWQATDAALQRLTDADLARHVPGIPDEPHMTVASLVLSGCIGHSWSHLGEIRYVKGLKGWRFRE